MGFLFFRKTLYEKLLMHDALVKAQGNRTKAAEILGISRRTLHRKLEKWPEIEGGG